MKILKYSLISALLIIVAYNSVYFRKLDDVKAAAEAGVFNAPQFAENFWNTRLLPFLGNGTEISGLIELLSRDPAKAFETHSHALGIGNIRYFLVKGEGKVNSVQPDGVTLTLDGAEEHKIIVVTEFIFGNAVRDATGLIDINEFSNTMDFNNVSAEMNKIVRERVLPPFLKKVKAGDVIEFTGALELNREHVDLVNLEVIPIQVSIK